MLKNSDTTPLDTPKVEEKNSPLLETVLNRGNFSVRALVLEQGNEHDLEQFVSKEVVPLYRTVFGGKPWNEYLQCNNAACGKKRSIQSVYGISNYFLTNLELNFDLRTARCLGCGDSMRFFYPANQKVQETLQELKKSIATAFLYKGDDLAGFCWMWLSSFDAIWEEKIAKISDKFSYEEYAEAIKKFFGDNLSLATPILYFADICTAPTNRSVDNYESLMRASFSQAFSKIKEDISIIAYSIQDETVYQLSAPVGMEHICKITGAESSIVCIPSLKRMSGMFNSKISLRQLLREQRRKKVALPPHPNF